MRALLVFSVVVFLSISAASLRAEAAGGAYETLAAVDAAACARRCADDSLCVSWAYRTDGACELRATGAAHAGADVAAGFSPRAPAFLRAATPAPSGATVERAASQEPTADGPLPIAEDALTAELLGGPDEQQSGIRPRLGN